jgi:Na+-transporting NADH:ubiquinone oxidoreductase subunit NqrF
MKHVVTTVTTTEEEADQIKTYSSVVDPETEFTNFEIHKLTTPFNPPWVYEPAYVFTLPPGWKVVVIVPSGDKWVKSGSYDNTQGVSPAGYSWRPYARCYCLPRLVIERKPS